MSGDTLIWRGLAVVAALLIAAAWRTGQRRLAQAAAAAAFVAGLGYVASPGAGLVLAGIALGSALALLTETEAQAGRSADWLALAGAAAAAALVAAVPMPISQGTAFAPLGVAALLLAALAWRTLGSASMLPLGRIALLLLLLLMPWGPDDLPITLWRAPALLSLPGSTAVAAISGLAWTPHPGDLWAHWPQLLLMVAATWLATRAATADHTGRQRAAIGVALVGAVSVVLAWQTDNEPALPLGVAAVQGAAWQADFGLFALAAWRWLAVLALTLRGRDGPLPSLHKLDLALPGLAGLAVVALALTTGEVAAISLPRDPAIWSLAAVLLASSARLVGSSGAPRWAAFAALVQWLAAASLCSGAAGGWSVAGLWG